MAVTVCDTCGGQGFVEALVYCDSCKLAAVHRYCLGITPVPFQEYITWFCADCDESDSGSDSKTVDHTAQLSHILNKKKTSKSSSYALPFLAVEDHELQDATSFEPAEVSSSPIKETMNESNGESNGLVRMGASVLEAGNRASGSPKSEEETKKKKKSINQTVLVLAVEDHGVIKPVTLSSSAVKETSEESKRRESSDNSKPHELTDLLSNGAPVLGKSVGNKKTNKEETKNAESINCTPPVLDVEDHGLQHTTNVEPVKASCLAIKETLKESKKRQSPDPGNSHELTGVGRNGVSVLEMSVKRKKKNKNKEEEIDESGSHAFAVLPSEDHGLKYYSNVEPVKLSFSPMKETMQSKRRESSDRNFHELTDLLRNVAPVLEKSENKKKNTNKEEKKKKNEESSNHTLSIFDVEDTGLLQTTNVEPVKESKKRESIDSGNSHELTGLVRNGVSVLETSVKKKKKKRDKSSNHTSAVLSTEDHGLHDSTSVELVDASSLPIKETMKECKKRKRSESGNFHEFTGLVRNGVSSLETNKKEKKTNKEEKKNEESSNHTTLVLAAEDHGLQDTTNDEAVKVSSSPNKEITMESKRQESSGSEKPNDVTGLVEHGASVSEGGISSSVPDHNSCTSKKRKLSSGNIQFTSGNTQLAVGNSSCKEAESNMLQINEVLTAMAFNALALNTDRAHPILRPIWRGSISLKNENICSIDGLVAHLSNLACHEVHKKASSLDVLLSAEMFPRMEIWPSRFLDKGQPTDESIALYFFPSSESSDGMVYYSLLCEMKKNDLAMRCVLDNVDLLLFTSYQLPMHCWTFQSKEYLWGIFRRRKTCRH